MKFKTLSGKIKTINITRHIASLDKKSRSKFQYNVKQFFLENGWSKHLVCEELPVAGTRMTIDLINLSKKIAVEVHGSQHSKMNKFFHRNVFDFQDQMIRDDQKREYLELNGFKLVEIWEKDMPLTKESVKEKFGIIL